MARIACALVLALAALPACATGEGGDDSGFTASMTNTTPPVDPTTSGGSTSGEPTTGEAEETGASAASMSGATTPPDVLCGDAMVGPGEACDDGNASNTDECLDTCKLASCGDGFVQTGVEDCDDANADQTDDCLADCTAPACGDGFVQAGVEMCDDGNALDSDGCVAGCVPNACGDGFLWDGVEGCDDGNVTPDDGCSATCSAATCGDGVVQGDLGEECDDMNADDTDACLATCKNATCGDGFVQAGVEQCDAGGMNNDNTGPCRTNCTACECQGNDVMGKTCADVMGFTCGQLACGGCSFNTAGCSSPPKPNFNGQAGPVFTDGCWQQCEGYLDKKDVEEVPAAWGDDCTNAAFGKIRVVCGAGLGQYRYITVSKNVFKDGLNAYPEVGLISDSKDQAGVSFATMNQIYATGNHPHMGQSWWGNGNGCDESSLSATINNSCPWEASNCFGQNLAGDRFLWVYVSP